VKPTDFLVGGRYRNRRGWYEVLKVAKESMTVRYEQDGNQANLDPLIAARIINNMEGEDRRVSPYLEDTDNQKYFWTLGYLSNHAFIEAIIPPKSKAGFDAHYRSMKGRPPQEGQDGYYVHHDEDVDKWGVEMRLTFPIPSSRQLSDCRFPGCEPVGSPDPDKLRVNSNAFCYRLLEIGFDLGDAHDVAVIESSIPERYRSAFREGRAAT